MGVYVFQTVCDWVKVGHHQSTRGRPNAYYRIAGRGFASCVHPPELEGRLGVADLTLVAWYPTLTVVDERALHAHFRGATVGEFHPVAHLPQLLALCEARGGVRVRVTSRQRARALEWGWRRVRKAKRRRARQA